MAETPDQTQIARLVVDHHADVYRYAYRLAGTAEDAEDLTQQTFLAAQTKLAQLRSQSTARQWLYAILRNHYLKSKRRRVPVPAACIELDVNDIPADAPAESIVDRERLQAGLDALTDEYKIVLLMFYFEDCSYREIADQLEIPVGTVMSRLSRAKSQLRGRLYEAELAAHGSRDTAGAQRSD